ncbi:MAG TPA: hypothetical protein VGT01_07755 [Candidatus Dormibacteraeota bacterium]|nr:hypothetical protein [Candidatus Dormibacteraeota bacterium]
MDTKPDQSEGERQALLMQALSNQYGRLQAARGGTIAESSSRTSVYLTTLTGAVVALSFVAQASKFGDAFFVFALAVLPVLFFLGTVTYYRLLQTGVEDVIYARSMSRIQKFFSEIDPARADLFSATAVDFVGLASLGLFKLRWQQFLSAAAIVAIVNAIVAAVFISVSVAYMFRPKPLLAIAAGAVAALVIALAFLRHQWLTWMRVARALPMTEVAR